MKTVCREMLEPDISVMYPRPLEVLVISVKQDQLEYLGCIQNHVCNIKHLLRTTDQ